MATTAPPYVFTGNELVTIYPTAANGAPAANELRVPISTLANFIGGGSNLPLTYSGATSASITTSSTALFSAGAYTRAVTMQTLPSGVGNVYLNVEGGAAVVGAGPFIAAGGGSLSFGTAALPMPTAAVTAISDSGTVTVTLAGG